MELVGKSHITTKLLSSPPTARILSSDRKETEKIFNRKINLLRGCGDGPCDSRCLFASSSTATKQIFEALTRFDPLQRVIGSEKGPDT
eukprot:765713-Hanusia_phi.AAC.7